MVREDGAGSCAHIPVRTCVGCRTRAPKNELLRVVAGGPGDGQTVVADPPGTASGRGAYLHPSPECLDLAVRRRALARALRLEGRLDVEPLELHLQQRSTGS